MMTLGAGDVRFTELMYHPASEEVREEYLEVHNPGPEAVNLAGWRLTTGVRFTFPDVWLPAGGYLAVVADPTTFQSLHPAVTNWVGGWDGILSNSGQRVELVDAAGRVSDTVRYADEGDWATRERGPVDYGHRGWHWTSAADGGGSSLELVNLALPGGHGQNWQPSRTLRGTPGQSNSTAQTNTAPLILEPHHFPLIPHAADPVAVTARLLDESSAQESLRLVVHHRLDGQPEFVRTDLVDDGQHGDGGIGDGVWGATLPPQPAGTVVEFYFEAWDGTGARRTYPAPAVRDDERVQEVNLLYQVDEGVTDGTMPVYRLVLRATDLAELAQINANTPAAPHPTSDQTRSHAQVNGTFISQDALGAELRYQVGVRNRGNGSRVRRPQSYRVNFRNDQHWKEVAAINLNGRYPHAQLLGSALYRLAGLTTQESRPVQLRVNGVNPATSASPSFGFYVANEVLNSEFAARAFPGDDSGNLYRGIRLVGRGADLHFEGEMPEPYRSNYFKLSNTSEDDWSDLIALTRGLDTAPAESYATVVAELIDVRQWMLYFALETLVDNQETNLANGDNGSGEGDDYFLYFGQTDRRAKVLPYDLDTILNQGDTPGKVEDGLFRMAAGRVIGRLIQHPRIVPVYYDTLQRLAETVFTPTRFDAFVDQTLGGLVSETVRQNLKDFAAARSAAVLKQIPTSLTVSHGLTAESGYWQTTNATIVLTGRAPAVATRAVLVNGELADWTAWNATWSATNVVLLPGINRVLIEARGQGGQSVERTNLEVWYATETGTPHAGPIAQDTLWRAAEGPHRVTATVTVAAGATLTLEPGTTVFFEPDTELRVEGRLEAIGTDAHRIRLAKRPGTTGGWAGVRLVDTGTRASWLAQVDFDGAGSAGHSVRAERSTLYLEGCHFLHTTTQYVDLIDSSFHLRENVFPATAGTELIHGSGLPHDGFGILQGNFFGGTSGYNDIIDFTGGNRPDAIVQFLDNVFAQGSDDGFDMDGTDAHIEGNLFLEVRQDAPRASTSNAISTGAGGGQRSELTVVRNVFHHVDHALLLKDGGSAVFHQNTVVGVQDNPSDDAPGAVINYYEARSGVTPGGRADLDGNILWDVTAGRLANAFTNPPSELIIRRSIVPGPLPAGAVGEGLVTEDPRFVGAPGTVTPANARAAFALRPGSPAAGTGLNGLDLGARVPPGASIGGEPPAMTWQTRATLTVAGPGITHYRYALGSAAPPMDPQQPAAWQVGPWSAIRTVSEPIQLLDLTNGLYRVQVVGRNSAGVWQTESVAPAPAAYRPTESTLAQPTPVPSTLSRIWRVDAAYRAVRLNEVLAWNTRTDQGGSDLIELFNDSPEPVNLEGLRLSTEPSLAEAFVFPAGTWIEAGGYLILHADEDRNAPGLHLGFELNRNGERLWLFDRLERGGPVLDQVEFGPQLENLSIGRTDGETWELNLPTFGGPNRRHRVGDPARLRLNEWLAAGRSVFRNDFIELYNADTLPVALGGLLLTDATVSPVAAKGMLADELRPGTLESAPAGTRLTPLSFIAAQGFQTFEADGHPEQGPTHLAFRLNADQGVIGLVEVTHPADASTPTPLGSPPPTGLQILRVLDSVAYGPQIPDRSEGRQPNGTDRFAFFIQPSPGGSNPGARTLTNVVHWTLPLLAFTNDWRYWTNGAPDPFWADEFFNDYGWPLGPGPLGHDGDTLPLPLQTHLPIGRSSYYFRATFLCPTNPTGGHLELQTFIDDGAAFWLNGELWHRQNLSATNLEYGTWADHTVDKATLEGPIERDLGLLRHGYNVLAVEVHQRNAGSSDLVFGLRLDLKLSVTNVVRDDMPARLNEVLARNRSLAETDGTTPDWIELFNPGPAVADLTDGSLTDDPSQPRRWVFPAETRLEPGGRLRVRCDASAPPSATNTGFDLDAAGGHVALFDAPARHGAMVDAVRYGPQAADFALARIPDGTGAWRLARPTPGTENLPASLGEPRQLKLNEWMASNPDGEDWFELFNPQPEPVALGELGVSDDLTDRQPFLLPALSFIGGGDRGFLRLWASGEPQRSGDHVDFKLSAAGDSIGLFDATGALFEWVRFGAQRAGVAEGRLPDGGPAPFVAFPGAATPGRSNALPDPGGEDIDQDGLPDLWETAQGLNPADPSDAGRDDDRDGLTNLEEYRVGTDPRDAASTLRLALSDVGEQIRLTCDLPPHRAAALEVRASLDPGAWSTVAEWPASASPVQAVVFITPLPHAPAASFYRIVIRPPP